ncbi:hypothetical protein ANO14919_134590 [Xylariales sp. No.14919]|nr:hypothetical protein ANO14919_134590 [Xylariales sp. No.14919]
MNAWTTEERIDRWRKKKYYEFRNYREGRHIDVDDYQDLPRAGEAPEVYYPAMVQFADPVILRDRDEMDIDNVADPLHLPYQYVKAYRTCQTLKQQFAQNFPHLRYQKCLGWGGNGMAAAFEDIDRNGQKVRSVVVKMLFSNSPEAMQMETEMRKFPVLEARARSRVVLDRMLMAPRLEQSRQVYLRAEHIVQILYDNAHGLFSGDSDDKDVDLRMDTDDGGNNDGDPGPSATGGRPRFNVFMTELLANGDLSHFIAKVWSHQEVFPNQVLWHFFLCFVRMCIGMAYPPKETDTLKDLPAPVSEVIPPGDPRRIVHFDFDPRNIFIGEVGEGTAAEHSFTPLLKLGDFGLATEIEPGKSDFYYERFRSFGKRGYYSPEQFCVDWEYIAPDTFQIHNHPIAGNYGIHTNIWAVGYVMESLITACHPAQPPVPTEVSDTPPQGKDKYFTYAGHLKQDVYNNFDRDLISVTMRCQAHLPADRPTLAELLQIAEAGVAKGGDGTWQQLSDWVNKILYEPPPDLPDYMKRLVRVQGREIVGHPPLNPIRPPNAPPPGAAQAGFGGRPQRRPLHARGLRDQPWAYHGGAPPEPARPPLPAIEPLGPLHQGALVASPDQLETGQALASPLGALRLGEAGQASRRGGPPSGRGRGGRGRGGRGRGGRGRGVFQQGAVPDPFAPRRGGFQQGAVPDPFAPAPAGGQQAPPPAGQGQGWSSS